MAVGCVGEKVKVYETATLKPKAELTKKAFVAAFSADSKSLLVADLNGTPHWQDVKTLATRPVPGYEGNIHRVEAVAVSPDRRTAALGLPEGTIQILEIETGKPLVPPLNGHEGPVRSLAFSPSGDVLASGGSDNYVKLWDVKTRQCLGACSEHKGNVFGVTISPDGKTLASGCGAETIKFWNTANVKTGAVVSLSYHKSVIRTLAYSPDGKTLASGSEDKTVRLWNVALHAEVARLKQDAPVRLVVFSPDGRTLATVTDSGAVRIFRAVGIGEMEDDARNQMR